MIQIAPTRFRIQDASASELIRFAYAIRSEKQVQHGPRWTIVEKFDVEAKIDDAQAVTAKKLSPSLQMNQYRLMLQSLLKERFVLKIHTQTEELPVYALEISKGGPKLTPAARYDHLACRASANRARDGALP